MAHTLSLTSCPNAQAFDQLSRGQFKRLIAAGERVALPSGTTLTVEREVCDKLFFILDGSAAMSLNGQHTTTIHRGIRFSVLAKLGINCDFNRKPLSYEMR